MPSPLAQMAIMGVIPLIITKTTRIVEEVNHPLPVIQVIYSTRVVSDSAVAISLDSNIRKSIRRFVSAQDSSTLLESIGTLHMQQEIERRVLRFAKKQQQALVEQSGLQPSPFLSSTSSSLDEAEIKQYLDMVIQEVSKDKNKQEQREISD